MALKASADPQGVDRRTVLKGMAAAGTAFAALTGYQPLVFAQDNVLRIGWIKATTGKAVSTYSTIFAGGLVAIEEINQAGGINGRKVVPFELDDEGSPSTQPAIVRRLVEEKIGIAAGPGGSSQALSSLAGTSPNKILSTTYALSEELGDGTKYPYHYQFVFNTRAQAEAAVDYLVDKRGLKKIGILQEQTAFGEALTKTTTELLEKRGLKPTIVQTVPLVATAVLPNVSNIKNSGAEALCAWVSLVPAYGLTFKALADLDWTPTLICHISAMTETLFEMAPEKVFKDAVATAYKTLTWTDSEAIGARQLAYLEKVKQIPNMIGNEPLAMMAPFYDYLHALKKVADEKKSVDPAVLKEGMDALTNYDAMLGKVSFSAINHSGHSASSIALAKLLSARDSRARGIFRERA